MTYIALLVIYLVFSRKLYKVNDVAADLQHGTIINYIKIPVGGLVIQFALLELKYLFVGIPLSHELIAGIAGVWEVGVPIVVSFGTMRYIAKFSNIDTDVSGWVYVVAAIIGIIGTAIDWYNLKAILDMSGSFNYAVTYDMSEPGWLLTPPGPLFGIAIFVCRVVPAIVCAISSLRNVNKK